MAWGIAGATWVAVLGARALGADPICAVLGAIGGGGKSSSAAKCAVAVAGGALCAGAGAAGSIGAAIGGSVTGSVSISGARSTSRRRISCPAQNTRTAPRGRSARVVYTTSACTEYPSSDKPTR